MKINSNKLKLSFIILSATFLWGVTVDGYASSLLWKAELKHPVDSILVSSNGTAVATSASPSPFSLTTLSGDGKIIASTVNDSTRKIVSSPLMEEDDLYIPVTWNNGFQSIHKYTSQDQFNKEMIVFQGKNEREIDGMKLSRDHRNLYVSVGSSLFAVNSKKWNFPSHIIWESRFLNSVGFMTFGSNDSELIAFLSFANGPKSSVRINEKDGSGAPDSSLISAVNSDAAIQDKDGYIYGVSDFDSSIVHKINPGDLQKPLWSYDSGQKYPNKGYRLYSFGVNDQLYESYDDIIYAINKSTGDELFRIPFPVKGNSNIFSGNVVTDPLTGWGYRSYIQYSPEKKVGVIGFSPDGKTVRNVAEIKGGGCNIKISTPSIWNGKLYITSGKSVYVYSLPGTSVPQQSLDGNIIQENERNKPHRISWEVKNKQGEIDTSASGHIDFDGTDPMLLDQYRWPLLVSEAINKQKGMLQAGPKVEPNGKIEPGAPVASQYLNWLWLPETRVQDGYHAEISVTKMTDLPKSDWLLNTDGPQSFESHDGDDFRGKTVRFIVALTNGDIISKDFTTAEQDRFSAVLDIAHQVNRGLYLGGVKIGEKTSGLSGYEIKPLKSQYRNKIWAKRESLVASVTYEIIN